MNDNEKIKRENTSDTKPYKQQSHIQQSTNKIKNPSSKSVPVRLKCKVKTTHKDETSQSENSSLNLKEIDETKEIKTEQKPTNSENKNSQYQPPIQPNPPYQQPSPQNQPYQPNQPQYPNNKPYQPYPPQYPQNTTNQKQPIKKDTIQNKLKRIMKAIVSFIVAHKKIIITLLCIEAVWMIASVCVSYSNQSSTPQKQNKTEQVSTQSYSVTERSEQSVEEESIEEKSVEEQSVKEESIKEQSVTESSAIKIETKNKYIDDNEDVDFNICEVKIKGEDNHSSNSYIQILCDVYNKSDNSLTFNADNYFKMNNKGIMASATSENDGTVIPAGESLNTYILFKYKLSSNKEFDNMILTVGKVEFPLISHIEDYTYEEFCGTYCWEGTNKYRMIIDHLYDNYYSIAFSNKYNISFYTMVLSSDGTFELPKKDTNKRIYKWIPDEHVIAVYRDFCDEKNIDLHYSKMKDKFTNLY